MMGKLAAMVDRFTTTLDCVDTPSSATISSTDSGTDPDRGHPRRRGRPQQAPHPGRPVRGTRAVRRLGGLHRRRVHHQGPHDGRAQRLHHPASRLRPAQTPREGADRQPGTRRYHLTPQNAGTIAALLTLREHVIGPILAGVRSPRRDATHHLDQRRPQLREDPHRHANPLPATWASTPPHRQHLVDRSLVSAYCARARHWAWGSCTPSRPARRPGEDREGVPACSAWWCTAAADRTGTTVTSGVGHHAHR